MTQTEAVIFTLGGWGLVLCAFMTLLTLFTLAWTEFQRRKPLKESSEEIDWPKSWAEISPTRDTWKAS